MDALKTGITGESKTVVSEKNTAITHGSGSVPVFATPAMIALMENAALSSVQPLLPEGHTTVGTKITSSHIAATPLGMEVTAKSELTEIDGKRLVFRVEAYDAKDKIGEGIHERFIINIEKFMQKNEEKKG
jgi:predicted thioesterase